MTDMRQFPYITLQDDLICSQKLKTYHKYIFTHIFVIWYTITT